MLSRPGSRVAHRQPLGEARGTRTPREERAGKLPLRKLRTGKMAGLTHVEEESRGEEATEAAEVATEDEEGEVPAVADTEADPNKNRSADHTIEILSFVL